MRDTAPGDALGYVVVHMPDRRSWQGFFVMPSYKDAGESMLANVRDANREAGAVPGGAPEVASGLPGVPDAEQPTVAALSAVLVELYS